MTQGERILGQAIGPGLQGNGGEEHPALLRPVRATRTTRERGHRAGLVQVRKVPLPIGARMDINRGKIAELGSMCYGVKARTEMSLRIAKSRGNSKVAEQLAALLDPFQELDHHFANGFDHPALVVYTDAAPRDPQISLSDYNNRKGNGLNKETVAQVLGAE